MNRQLFFLLLCLPFFLQSQQIENPAFTHFNSFEEMIDTFKQPTVDFRPVPLWVWHDKLDSSMLTRDLQEFKDKGFGGEFIHPRYGLITEYLSDEWFDCVEHSMKISKNLGLRLWIYDENSFPSGFAGGWVPELMPESANQPTGLLMKRLTKLDSNDYEIVLRDRNGTFEVVDGDINPDDGPFVVFEKSFYEKSKWFGGRSYVDLLIPGVTETFIDATMSGYEKRIGDEFAVHVPGVFTDEPNISPRKKNAMRFTPALFSEFEKRREYDLRPHLPSLFEPVGKWKQVRHNYYELLLELFIEHWSKPWHEYTEQHNLAWTGHYWEHGWPSPVHGGDNMAMYAYHQIPAVDMLFNTADQNSTQFGNIRAIKELSSIANQYNKVRALSETYGAAGWELTFEDMKRLGDWEYVLGVNFLNQHLTYMNLTGDRKHDFPQGISYQTPWWNHYRALNDYFSRLSVALSSGKQVNSIVVLEPTTTTWMYYSPTQSEEQLARIGESFHQFLTQLQDRFVEYDLGCEHVINTVGDVKEQKFVMGHRRYDTVVIPPDFETVDQRTFDLLTSFLDQGGTVICFGDPPTRIDGKLTSQLQSLATHINWKRIHSIAQLTRLIDPQPFSVEEPEKLGGDVYHMRRELKEGQLLFLTNFSLEESASGTCIINGRSARQLNPFTGDVSPYPGRREDEKLTLAFDLPPSGSLLLYIDRDEGAQPKVEPSPHEILETAASQIKRLSPNILTLDYCDIKVDSSHYEDIYFYTGGFNIWQAHGYPENPWVSSVQWKTEWVDADTFAADTGFEARYPFTVDQGVNLSSLRVVVENPTLWDVYINDNKVSPLPGEWAIDQTWGVFNIGQHMNIGENEIAVIMHPMSIYAEIEPVYIMGEFDLESQSQGWKLVPETALELGSWKKQGLPFYPYDVTYSKSVTLPRSRVHVKLKNWRGTVASVYVDGEKAGVICRPPYECDITPLIQEGEQTITVRVTGSFKNLLGPHHNITRRGIVTPWSFKYAPEHQPPGKEYDQLDYGLYEDFDILVAK